MKQSTQRILTTHVGSLIRPEPLLPFIRSKQSGQPYDQAAYRRCLADSVAEVVRRQAAAGIDVPSDGEFGKSMGHRVDYRAWWSYSFNRLDGLELTTTGLYDMPARRSRHGAVVLSHPPENPSGVSGDDRGQWIELLGFPGRLCGRPDNRVVIYTFFDKRVHIYLLW